jgi:hypothetical protein
MTPNGESISHRDPNSRAVRRVAALAPSRTRRRRLVRKERARKPDLVVAICAAEPTRLPERRGARAAQGKSRAARKETRLLVTLGAPYRADLLLEPTNQ